MFAKSLHCVLFFATLWIVDLLSSSVHGTLQARILEWVSIFFSRESSWPRDWTCNFCVSCFVSGFFTTEPLGVVIIIKYFKILHSSVQFSCPSMSDSLRPHELQHARPPCPSPTPRLHPNPCPSSQWCHPTISSTVVPFSSCPQSFPASGSFQRSQLFASGSQNTGVSASTSVLPMNTQDWSPLQRTGWVCLQSKGLSRVFSNTTVQKHQFFGTQPSSQSNSHIHTWPLEKLEPWLDGPLLAK